MGLEKLVFDKLLTEASLVAVIFIWLWWLERKERMECDSRLRQMTEKLFKATGTFKELITLIKETK